MTPSRAHVQETMATDRRRGRGLAVVGPRLLVGVVVFICTEVFSGASLAVGVWSPWTLVVTYWLYFAHFFLLTTLAVRTGRTSLGALYLWGVLFGLYESWITKVIWYGYGGDGKLVMGRIGPYGFSELSMVVLFHPVAAFLLPLSVACVLSPPLRRWFPDVSFLTGSSRIARVVQAYLTITFSLVMAMNSGGSARLVANLVVVLAALAALLRLARPALAEAEDPSIVVFGRTGTLGLVLYLALLYGLAYPLLRPDGLPSAPVQVLTFVFYGLAIGGIWAHRPRQPLPRDTAPVSPGEPARIARLFGLVLVLGLGLAFVGRTPAILLPTGVNLAAWTPLGFLLALASLASGVRERLEVRHSPA